MLDERGQKKGISGDGSGHAPPFRGSGAGESFPPKTVTDPHAGSPSADLCEPLPAPSVPRFVTPGQAAYAGSGMSAPFPENTIPRRRAGCNRTSGRIGAGNGVSRGIARRIQVWWAGFMCPECPEDAADKHPKPLPHASQMSLSTA